MYLYNRCGYASVVQMYFLFLHIETNTCCARVYELLVMQWVAVVASLGEEGTGKEGGCRERVLKGNYNSYILNTIITVHVQLM